VAEPSLVVERHSEHISKQCPKCNFGVEEGEVIVLCPVCKVPHHEDCWYDAGGCSRVGCRGVATERPIDAQTSLASAQRSRGARGASGEGAEGSQSSTAGNIVTVVAILAILWLLWFAIFR